jgi:hypothetical protein
VPNAAGQQEIEKIKRVPRLPVVGWILFGWLTIALALSAINFSHALHSYYSYHHGWISAHFSIAARNFANFGIGRFGGVPIVNNPPFGVSVEAYLHWPPLFHFALAGVYRIFGGSEAVSHAWMFVILIVNTILLGLLVHRCAGAVAAQFACLVWLGCGVIGTYSHLVWNVHMMMGLLFLALLGFVKAESNWKWGVIGAASFAAAIGTSWEAVFVCPGLLAMSCWSRDRRRMKLAAIYTVVAVVVPVAVLLNSAYRYPQQMTEVWQRVAFRMGLVHEYVSTYETSTRRQFAMPGLRTVIMTLLRRHYHYIGMVPLLGAAWLMVRAAASYRERLREEWLVIFAGLVSMWWLWVALFHSHVFIHDCQILIAAPASAFAAGIAGQWLVRLVERRLEYGPMLVAVIVPLILLAPLARATRDRERFIRYGGESQLRDAEFFVDVLFGKELLRRTESGAVIITPLESAVPLYYSERHLIQGVDSERGLGPALVVAKKNFPNSPLYLAIPTDAAQKFATALTEGKMVERESTMILVKVAKQAGM